MTKHLALLERVIFKYHPIYNKQTKACRALRAHIRNYPEHSNVERLIEETIAACGDLLFVDAHGYDYDDLSDAKTATVSYNDGRYTYKITNLGSKHGGVRIVMYNPFSPDLVDYFFLPENCYLLANLLTASNNKWRYAGSYNPKTGSYNKLDAYRVPDFETLATIRSPRVMTLALAASLALAA